MFTLFVNDIGFGKFFTLLMDLRSPKKRVRNTPVPDLGIESILKTSAKWRDVFIVTFDKKYTNFLPGDTLCLSAENHKEKIERVAKKFGWIAVDVQKDEGTCRDENCGNLYDAGENIYSTLAKVDLDIFPRKKLLKNMKEYAKNTVFLEKTINDSRLYIQMTNRHSLSDTVDLFGLKNFPLSIFLDSTDSIKPRPYTLINNRNENLKILVGVITKNEKYGHISECIMLDQLDKVGIAGFIKGNTNLDRIHEGIDNVINYTGALPEYRKNIFYCTGTGISLFYAFLNNREIYKNKKEFILVFGIRNDEDNLFPCLEAATKNSSHSTELIICKSSENNRVTQNLNFVKEDMNVIVCGNYVMQREIYMRLHEMYPQITTQKRLFLDRWL